MPILNQAVLWVAALASGADAEYPHAKLLIEPAALARQLEPSAPAADRPVVLDVREKKAYEQSHLPHAVAVDFAGWSKGFGDGNDAAGWSKRIAALGITAKTRVVVYDDAQSRDACRTWWILRYWGVESAQVLHGGWFGWNAAKLPVNADPPPAIKPSDFQAKAVSARLATKSQILESLARKSLQIVDARSEAEHCGTEKMTNRRGGAIPSARHLEWTELLDKKSQRFLPADAMRAKFKEAGIDLNLPTAAHCQSGGRAAVTAFALELLGAKDVKNYYRSWAEWGNAEDTPVVVPPPKSKP